MNRPAGTGSGRQQDLYSGGGTAGYCALPLRGGIESGTGWLRVGDVDGGAVPDLGGGGEEFLVVAV